MNRYYINKEWMLSAYCQARLSSRSDPVFDPRSDPDAAHLPGKLSRHVLEPLLLVVRRIVLAGILGTATTTIAMEYFIFGFDDSSG